MAYGSFALNKIQLGKETTPGTSVPATFVWRGQFSMLEDLSDIKVIPEQVGLLTVPERAYISKIAARLAMPPSAVTFEQIPHIFEASIGTATPTGAGPYVRAYAVPIDATINTYKTYTIETGNTNVPTDQLEMEYSYVDEVEFSGRIGEPWMAGVTWLGRQVTPATMTSALALPTVTDALFNKTKLYIDASGGTLGTTQKLGTLISAKLRFRSGLLQVPVGDGNFYFNVLKPGKPQLDFSITIEVESGSLIASERAAKAANSTRLFRLLIDQNTNNKIQFDFAGRYDKVGNYESSEGNTHVTLDGHATVDTAATLFFTSTITNNVATL